MNDGIHDSLLSGTVELRKDIYDLKSEFVLFLFEEKTNSYNREFFRTSINFTRVFNGFRGNYLLAPIIDSIIKTFDKDLELKFPIKKRSYMFENLTIPGKFLPPGSIRFKVEMKQWMKTTPRMNRKMDFASLFKVYGKLNWKIQSQSN